MVKYNSAFINGEFLTGTKRILIHPWSRMEMPVFVAANQVDLAVQAAKRQQSWANWSAKDRQSLLLKLSCVIIDHKDELSSLETIGGKPIKQAIEDVQAASQVFQYYGNRDYSEIQYYDPISGAKIKDSKSNGPVNFTKRQANGIVGLITSFNYPLLLMAWKVAPALLTGNRIILKPAINTCHSALLFANLATKVGLPIGVLNVLVGDKEEGEEMVINPQISTISFTGSTNVGKIINIECAKQLKQCHLELGGKNAAIIFPDCDLKESARLVFDGAFSNMGQNCCAISRLYLHEAIASDFKDALLNLSSEIVIGDPSRVETEFGPLVDSQSFERILGHIAKAKLDGILLLVEGKVDRERNLIGPTIFDCVPDSHFLAQEEIFGPVLSIMEPFTSKKSVIKRVNDSRFGLACGVFAGNRKTFELLSTNLETGFLWHNTYNWVPPWLPFGGMKESRAGLQELGDASIDAFSTTKSIVAI